MALSLVRGVVLMVMMRFEEGLAELEARLASLGMVCSGLR